MGVDSLAYSSENGAEWFMKSNREFTFKVILSIWSLVILSAMFNANASEVTAEPELPEGKQTSLELYVTAAEAYDKWLAAPDEVRGPGCTHA